MISKQFYMSSGWLYDWSRTVFLIKYSVYGFIGLLSAFIYKNTNLLLLYAAYGVDVRTDVLHSQEVNTAYLSSSTYSFLL